MEFSNTITLHIHVYTSYVRSGASFVEIDTLEILEKQVLQAQYYKAQHYKLHKLYKYKCYKASDVQVVQASHRPGLQGLRTALRTSGGTYSDSQKLQFTSKNSGLSTQIHTLHAY